MQKLEIWIPQTTEIGVLKFHILLELQATVLHKDFSSMGVFLFLLMFSRLSEIIVNIITSSSLLPDSTELLSAEHQG